VDQVTDAAHRGRNGRPIAQVADGNLIVAMDVGPRARGPYQHANAVAGGAGLAGNRRADEAAGAGDQDRIALAACQLCRHRGPGGHSFGPNIR
jgi:hypothetical protein